MPEKSLYERHKKDILTDNTQFKYCLQCKDCAYWGSDPKDYFSNAYDKVRCDKYTFSKPQEIIYNTGKCEFRKVKK